MNSGKVLKYDVVDVFTEKRFGGNPLAVVQLPLHDQPIEQEVKQNIAREFNLSETVFVHPQTEAQTEKREWRIDIFIPDHELPFAGHPVIGTAWLLHQPNDNSLTLLTKAGAIAVDFVPSTGEDARHIVARASIPHNFHVHEHETTRDCVLDMQPTLKVVESKLRTSFPVVSIVKGMTFVLIELDSTASLDLVALAAIHSREIAKLDNDWSPSYVGAYFYVSHDSELQAAGGLHSRIKVSCRMIEGTMEDPATGSAASTLAAYMATEVLKGQSCNSRCIDFELVQGKQMGRESNIGVTVIMNEDKTIKEVLLRGTAVNVMSGSLCI